MLRSLQRKQPLSEHAAEEHSDKTKPTSDVTTPIRLSERDADRSVLTSLAAVCRHWQVMLKTRSDVSRRQLCLISQKCCEYVYSTLVKLVGPLGVTAEELLTYV